MGWKPETTADLAKNFVETYASFRDVKGYASAATILGFMKAAVDRTGITQQQYLEAAMPIVNKLMIAEAMARGPRDQAKLKDWIADAKNNLYVAYGGKPEDLAGGNPNGGIMGLVNNSLKGVSDPRVAPQITSVAALPDLNARNDTAYGWMRREIQMDIEKARELQVATPDKVEAYSPPAVIGRVVNGLVEKSKFVRFKPIGTAMSDDELLDPAAAAAAAAAAPAPAAAPR
jgi:hypothetical protein